jgi:hypothetical protein
MPLDTIMNGTSSNGTSTLDPDTDTQLAFNASIASIADAADKYNSSLSLSSLFKSRGSQGFGDSVEGSSVGAGGYMGLLLGGGVGLLTLAAGIMYWNRRRAAARLEAALVAAVRDPGSTPQ